MKEKKLFIVSALALAALLPTSCSDDDSAGNAPRMTEQVTVEASQDGDILGASTRAALNGRTAVWESGDKLTIWTGTVSAATRSDDFTCASAGTATSKFSGTLVYDELPESSTVLTAFVQSSALTVDDAAGTGTITLDMSTQAGTADKVLDYDLMWGTSTYAKRKFSFSHKIAVLKYTVRLDGVSSNTTADIRLVAAAGLKSSAVFTASTGVESTTADGSILIDDVAVTTADGDGLAEVYIALYPGTYTNLRAIVQVDNGAAGFASTLVGSGNFTLTAGNVYTASASVTPVVPEFVDLGLPNGTKWATFNVGATSPEEYGDYFAWGETTGYGSDTSDGHSFDWASYFDSDNGSTFTKYYNGSGGKTVLDSDDDAATFNWGSAWRMPTYAEMQELVSNTVSEWGILNGVNGRYFYKKDGSGNKVADTYIFLPAAGHRHDANRDAYRNYCFYWSSSLSEDYVSDHGSDHAHLLYCKSDDSFMNYGIRYLGRSVRPLRTQ